MINKYIPMALLASLLASPAFAEEKKAEAPATPTSVVDKLEVNVTGEVRAFVEGSKATDHDLEVKSTDTNLGVNVKSKGTTYVFGHLSAAVDINGNGNDDVTTNYGYVGVGNAVFGELSIGKTKSIMEEFVNKTDVFYSAGNLGVQKTEKKMRNSMKYMNAINDVSFGIQAQMTDDAQDKSIDLMQVGAGYMGLGVTIARDAVNDINWYGVGYSHTFMDKILVAASYTIKDNAAISDASFMDTLKWDNSDTTGVTRGIEVAAGYNFTPSTQALIGYQDTDVVGDDGAVTTELRHSVSKSATAFTNVTYDIDSEDYVYRAGVSVTF